MPTSHPRHSITETPALAAALRRLRERLGPGAPTLAELVLKGADAVLRELDASDRTLGRSRATFVDRLVSAAPVDLDESERIRRSSRRP